MRVTRRAADRGATRLSWLDGRHTFSFGDYFDPEAMGFRALRVINEDRVAPGGGFGTHPHRDMEILTYVIEGALEHRDSMGHGEVIRAGELQRMTAGTGVTHSEMNPSRSEPVHLLQVWIRPEREGLPPSYEQRAFPSSGRRDRLRVVASRDGREGSLRVHQDADVHDVELSPGARVEHRLRSGRHAWVHVVRGRVVVDGDELEGGSGVGISGASAVALSGGPDGGEALLFDLA